MSTSDQPRDPAACPKAQRDLISLLGTALLITVLAVAIWAFAGAGAFWPVWVIGAFTVALAAAAARAAAGRPRRAAHPSPDGRGA